MQTILVVAANSCPVFFLTLVIEISDFLYTTIRYTRSKWNSLKLQLSWKALPGQRCDSSSKTASIPQDPRLAGRRVAEAQTAAQSGKLGWDISYAGHRVEQRTPNTGRDTGDRSLRKNLSNKLTSF